MADYAITFARSARKELENLPEQVADRIIHKVAAFAQNPRPIGATKLKGQGNLWRIRVGDYRIVYEINDRAHSVDISLVRHRRDVYRDL